MRLLMTVITAIALFFATALRGQAPTGHPADAALREMVDTERAFAQLAQVKGWKQAFLEYFADGIRNFEGEDIKAGLRARPDPPKDLEFWWEPRYGDIAASGELGWLTGPVRRRAPAVNEGRPSYSCYTSIWKRQADGTFKVIVDVGVDVPEAAPFPPGVTRVPLGSRYTGASGADAGRDSLQRADRELTERATKQIADAYRAALAAPARMHRPELMPLTGASAIVDWLRGRPSWTAGTPRFAEASRAGDLGYTWGDYRSPESASAPAETGHYLRVWSRDGAGAWRVVVEVSQIQKAF
ncbi:MAG TPA: hypothetical protein VK886_16495 [Vicinamibacterales bacterium]|nr:hypothetical protein [Vicinamibacterales bacterium]